MSRKEPSRPPPPSSEPVRLQAFLARAGVASRRASEDLIREGRVTINGRMAEIGAKVDPSRDIVRVDRRVVSERETEWVMLHKPRGFVTTREDPEGRKTVYELLPPELHHLFHVGRLDRDSSGLLLLTNDGEAANRLLHPRYETTKEYRVDVEGKPSRETLRTLVEGVELEDGVARANSVEMAGEAASGFYRLILVLQEGRNREVRRLLEAVGHPVRRLFRRAFGPLEIGRLRPGEWRRLEPKEVEVLQGRGRAQGSGKASSFPRERESSSSEARGKPSFPRKRQSSRSEGEGTSVPARAKKGRSSSHGDSERRRSQSQADRQEGARGPRGGSSQGKRKPGTGRKRPGERQ